MFWLLILIAFDIFFNSNNISKIKKVNQPTKNDIIVVVIVIILTKIINLIKPQNNFKKKLKIFGNIKNKTIFVIQ